MKIKAIGRICTQAKRVYLYDKISPDGEIVEQWIGDGVAIYPTLNLPLLEAESIYTIFDVPEKKRTTFFYKHGPVPENITLQDNIATEQVVDRLPLEIVSTGRILKPLQTRTGIVFIDAKYLAPLADIIETLELYERRTESGAIYIAAKAGLILMGIITICDVINEDFVDKLEELTSQCRYSLQEKNRRRQMIAEGKTSSMMDEGQTTFDDGPEVEE